jgi:hypothetical protein
MAAAYFNRHTAVVGLVTVPPLVLRQGDDHYPENRSAINRVPRLDEGIVLSIVQHGAKPLLRSRASSELSLQSFDHVPHLFDPEQ